MTGPETSIVIRTFNEEKHLPALLEAIQVQNYQHFETVVVDSGSFDRTREIAGRYCDKVLRINSQDFTFGYSLNVGVKASEGRFIVIVSAHTKPVDRLWLGNLVGPLRDGVAMVYGKQLGGETSKFSEVQDFRRTFGPQRRVLIPPNFFANNANSAIRKDLWEQHPFDEALPGLEDIEWSKYWMEKGYQVLYEPEVAIYHIHEESWRQVHRRYYREGLAAHWIGLKGRGHVPLEILREGTYLLGDLYQAVRDNDTWRKLPEIVLFRVHKTLGTTKGLLDGAAMTNPAEREAMFFDRISQTVVIHGPGRASFDEVEVPKVKPGDVLIKVAYEGVCATDLEILEGTLGYYKNGMAKYPIIPGHEFSGQVVKVGPNVKDLREGDPVVVECIQSCGTCTECRHGNYIGCPKRAEIGVMGRDGGYAEYVVVPGRFVHRLPSDLDLRKACLCEPLAVALKGVKRLSRAWSPQPEVKRCAVVGVGPLGHLCARVLSLQGHEVTAFDRNPLRRSYFEGSDVKTSDDLKRLGEFDVLLEVTGDPEALHAILHESAAGATILLLGLPYARREFTFESVVAYDKTVVGSVGSSAEDFEEAIATLPQIDATVFMEKVLPLSAFGQAWELVRTQAHLKVMLEAG